MNDRTRQKEDSEITELKKELAKAHAEIQRLQMIYKTQDKDMSQRPVDLASVGAKIKRVRKLRGYTQKQLGIMCGFTYNTADVRIGQYESSEIKAPREKTLKDIANALHISQDALFNADMSIKGQMYHALFDMEDCYGLHPEKKGATFILNLAAAPFTERM